jgi:hypothetical protein
VINYFYMKKREVTPMAPFLAVENPDVVKEALVGEDAVKILPMDLFQVEKDLRSLVSRQSKGVESMLSLITHLEEADTETLHKLRDMFLSTNRPLLTEVPTDIRPAFSKKCLEFIDAKLAELSRAEN